MSRIYFHAPHRTAEVGGSERHYFNQLATKIALSLLDPHNSRQMEESVLPYVVGGNYRYERQYPGRWAAVFAFGHVSSDQMTFRINDEEIGALDLSLNTLVAMGSPVLSFVAHVTGCCESHGWLHSHHARWLQDVIAKGLESKVLRAGQGWEDVMALANEVYENTSEPIVMSYSVESGFPNAVAAEWSIEDPPWENLSRDDRWLYATASLMAKDWPFPMGPDKIDQGFGSGASVFDLMAQTWVGQLAGRQES